MIINTILGSDPHNSFIEKPNHRYEANRQFMCGFNIFSYFHSIHILITCRSGNAGNGSLYLSNINNKDKDEDEIKSKNCKIISNE